MALRRSPARPMIATSFEDPAERIARPAPGVGFTILTVDARDGALAAELTAWRVIAMALAAREEAAATRVRLEDDHRIVGELADSLAGAEAREDRRYLVAVATGRVQAVCALFDCAGGAFVELVATAPWNLVRRAQPDPRAAPGAGAALVAAAERRARARGCGGRVALQAENARARHAYERLGFAAMQSSDVPLALVPPGEVGWWSDSIARLARGCPAPEDVLAPWMPRDPERDRVALERRAA